MLGLSAPHIPMMVAQNGRTTCLYFQFTLCHSSILTFSIFRPHTGWLDMAKPFIKAFHAGASAVTADMVDDEKIIYWYRQNPKSTNCDSTDTTMVAADNSSGNYFEGKPNGYDTMQDSIFIVSLLKTPGTISVTSGTGTPINYSAPAGAFSSSVPMNLGSQSFSLLRNGQPVSNMTDTSLKQITDACNCGIYNFNAYVGTVPPAASDPLQSAGLVSLLSGLKVSTCQPTPSLGTATGYVANPTSTGGSGVENSTGYGGGSGTTSIPAIIGTNPTSVATGPLAASSASSNTVIQYVTSTSSLYISVSSTTSFTTACASSTSSPPAASIISNTTSSSGSICVNGTVSDSSQTGFLGLCSFNCNYNNCLQPCTCTQYGQTAVQTPSTVNVIGTAAAAEATDAAFAPLCSFACGHGYCPDAVCTSTPS